MDKRRGGKAIVIGASVAGLVTARVLSDHFDRVKILERDRLPDEAVVRRGVPQGRHAHVLLTAGQQLFNVWFPGLANDLLAGGAVPFRTRDVLWHQGGAYWVRPDPGHPGLSMSRPLLERAIRRQLLLERSNVSIADDVAVDGLILDDDRVVGVRSDGAEHRADLVVGCTGRNTRFLDHLADAGYPAPEVSAVPIDVAYGTRLMRRRPGRGDDVPAFILGDPAGDHRVGTALPVEGDRWIVTLGAVPGEALPTDPGEFEEFARTLPAPILADILTRCQALSPVLVQGLATSQRRHVERLRRTPAGFVVLGDAICSVNPIYGQGMSTAAMQAEALGQAIEQHGCTSPALPRDFYRRAAKAVDMPWRMAAGSAFTGRRSGVSGTIGAQIVDRYFGKVIQACHTSVPVARRMVRVQNLTARPATLMTPAMIIRVLLASRRSQARGDSRLTTDGAMVGRRQ
jgi:2-polyprenyl-6-methoxyphenol hydroxylase-like FAD-dependent oxidoreductase